MPKALKAVPLPPASEPAQFTVAEAVAVQALAVYKADAEQQRVALQWIMDSACGLKGWAYRESQRETDIGLGRQFVAQQISAICRVNISTLKQREETING